ncbi:hypothetical protein MKW98_014496 [Papaver atlanticum]|uniref:Uncharacterized protein n=1 Tax=Papaver atlanticum TaxID=357466 RepID=A0AAD4SL11_9MAGN|nr:hypothetical protein MKW98_014496 [Papaver atlanticum]
MSSSISLYDQISSHEADEHHHESSSSRRNSKWIIDVKENLDKMEEWRNVDHWMKKCIYEIPAYLTDLNKKAFNPVAVSFGPFHHGEDQLIPMEEHKHYSSYMDALHRVGKPLINSYDWLDETTNNDYRDQYGNYSDKFLELMMLDGCFMLEILRTATRIIYDYASNDPIFSYHLDTLLDVETSGAGNNTNGDKPKDEEYLNNIIIRFFTPNRPTHIVGRCRHVLDVYRKNVLQEPYNKPHKPHGQGKNGHSEYSFDIIRSATELYEAGIHFQTSKTLNLKGISFSGGVLQLPIIVVDDTTESTFLNLMAYERFHDGERNDVTDCIFFMANIIGSAKDVSLLHSKGIIQNALRSDKAAVKLFDELSKYMAPDPYSRLRKLHQEVNDYCETRRNKWRANLIRTYFKSPWTIISLLADIVLMTPTFSQTTYAIYPYYHPRDSTKAPPHPCSLG